MQWKLKAKIQNIVSYLPKAASYNAYYWIQRHFGGLRRVNPLKALIGGIETWKRIKSQDRSPSGKVFFEVGTERIPLVPLAYWLMGAEGTISIDLNPYLKEELIAESLRYISENEGEVLKLFGSLLDNDRFNSLLNFTKKTSFSTTEFLNLCQISYIAPGDAADTRLPDNSIDFHTSYTVFEHIPIDILREIIGEGNRIIRKNGLFVHRIDYSDHFSHSDKSISAINFLQYGDDEWQKYAGNRYMYMNRLRHDDFIILFESAGHRILGSQTDMDLHTQEILRSGKLRLNDRFSSKPADVLAITGSWMITQKNSE
ncbi:MAG: methyltransferase domain-containing protein [Planctomycetia bacterium]|nr:methyltransferase domain-containing protein [Candidatus Brocadia sp.]QOJ06622.1 MAG: methyltransferase domain-containing protein [Planctomycetia bacterium]HQU32564.1 methyltransferase domain-containing protein [Candidatus Brocadia sapporoensis]